MLTASEVVAKGINSYLGTVSVLPANVDPQLYTTRPRKSNVEKKTSREETKYKSKCVIKNEGDVLGERMQMAEAEYERNVPNQHAMIIPLDGHCFRTYTAMLKRNMAHRCWPFDPCFTKAMMNACKKLLEENSDIATAYTHSDEITLIFPAIPLNSEPRRQRTRNYKGRMSKLLTHLSCIAANEFNRTLRMLLQKYESPVCKGNGQLTEEHYFNDEKTRLMIPAQYYYPSAVVDWYNENDAVFDARVLSFPPETAAANIVDHQEWRSMYDCKRNCVRQYGEDLFFSAKDLSEKSTGEVIRMMAEKGFDFDARVPIHLQHGVYLKRFIVEVPVDEMHQKTPGQMVARSKFEAKSFLIPESRDVKAIYKLLTDKYWNGTKERDGTVVYTTPSVELVSWSERKLFFTGSTRVTCEPSFDEEVLVKMIMDQSRSIEQYLKAYEQMPKLEKEAARLRQAMKKFEKTRIVKGLELLSIPLLTPQEEAAVKEITERRMKGEPCTVDTTPPTAEETARLEQTLKSLQGTDWS